MVVLMKNKQMKLKIKELSVNLLAGKIQAIDYLSFFEENDKYLKWYNKYALKHQLDIIENISDLKLKLTKSLNIKMYIFQLARLFLNSMKVDYEIIDEDYSYDIKLQNQCPEWLPWNLDLFTSIYPNLKELLDSNTFCEQVTKDFKCINQYPDWLQPPEWPVIDGVICVFEKQSMLVDDMHWEDYMITYTFINPKTNEKVIVEQYD